MNPQPAFFEQHAIRRVYDEPSETWFFSVIDIVQVLTQSSDYQTARKYWKVLKGRLDKEGSQLVTNCHQLKMTWVGRMRRFRRHPTFFGIPDLSDDAMHPLIQATKRQRYV